MKRTNYEILKRTKKWEINNMNTSVEENKNRCTKIAGEKDALELQTSKGNENLIDEKIFNRIVEKITITRNLYDKTRARAQN